MQLSVYSSLIVSIIGCLIICFLIYDLTMKVILLIGHVGGLLAQAMRLPRIVAMILLGIAIYPSLHPSIFFKGAGPKGIDFDVSGGAVNPAGAIRAVALLIAIARGGLSVKWSFVKRMKLITLLLATLPYTLELVSYIAMLFYWEASQICRLKVVEAFLVPIFLPEYYGAKAPGGQPPMLACFLSASVWAGLGPGIIVPNMLKVSLHV